MTRNPKTPAPKARQNGDTPARHSGNSHARSATAGQGAGAVPEWFNGSLATPKKAMDALLEMQCQWLKNASTSGESLVQELKELQQARDPVQLASAQFTLANQQFEAFTREVSAVMQQIYDAQLLWLGQWDEKSGDAPRPSAAAQENQSALRALGQVQDEWLKVTRSWIDSINAGSRSL